jgi:hypothetical protein
MGVTQWIFCALDGWIAQSVEQRTENPCVAGSIPAPATNFISSCIHRRFLTFAISKTAQVLPKVLPETAVSIVFRSVHNRLKIDNEVTSPESSLRLFRNLFFKWSILTDKKFITFPIFRSSWLTLFALPPEQ